MHQVLERIRPVPDERLWRLGREVVVWVITLFLAQAFLPAGYAKLFDGSGWTEAFTVWGYPAEFRRLVGVTEIAGGLLILRPRWAWLGAALIFLVMTGAIATHVRLGEFRNAYVSDLPSFSFSAALLLARWPGVRAARSDRRT